MTNLGSTGAMSMRMTQCAVGCLAWAKVKSWKGFQASLNTKVQKRKLRKMRVKVTEIELIIDKQS